ncbi:MAG: hypothetical protein OEV30_00805 [Ignavibacteria bacterium]|nr:hypothetical protein [Ignavibacteria bacterium]
MNRIRTMHTLIKMTVAVLLMSLVALLDYLSGSELSFSIFYIFPVLATSWFVGHRAALTMAVLSSAVWLAVDTAAGATYSHYLIPIWNALVRLIFFVVVGVVVPHLRLEIQHSHLALKRLTELLPMCAWCRNIRDAEGAWSSLEEYIETHTGSEVTHGICPRCIDKHFPRQRGAAGAGDLNPHTQPSVSPLTTIT